MRRVVEPEILDTLPPDDPQAIRSRSDLRRLNVLMGHAEHLTRAIHHPNEGDPFRSSPLQLVDLGAGDGSLLLRLARRWSGLGVKADVTLLDRHHLVSTETRRAFEALHWSVKAVACDVFTWLESPSGVAGVMLANLFLHHFPEDRLAALLRLASAKTSLFLACEPRRSRFALRAARCLALVGCNAVTRHDAVVSVRAGFNRQELSDLWPQTAEWKLREQPVGLFSHCFFARRSV